MCIEKLEREGAVVVGNMKLASITATEEPVEYVDFQAPWNPKGEAPRLPSDDSLRFVCAWWHRLLLVQRALRVDQ
jgi:hypothetical protein